MAYSELIKNFNRTRDYMREFYIYGFKSREEYNKKSLCSYDDERRRMESWLGDSMQFLQTSEGKNVFISIDSRVSKHNPLYKAWIQALCTTGACKWRKGESHKRDGLKCGFHVRLWR